MKITWRLFTNAQSESSARLLVQRFFEVADLGYELVELAPYHKGGYLVSACSIVAGPSWADRVLIALRRAQLVGHQWTISGNVDEELDAWSSDLKVSGLEAVQLIMQCDEEHSGAGTNGA